VAINNTVISGLHGRKTAYCEVPANHRSDNILPSDHTIVHDHPF